MRATGARGSAAAAAVLLITVAALHVLGFAAAPALSALRDRFRADAMLTGSIALACMFALFLSKSITEATEALYQRGDLDLLLSSPLPMRRVLATRLLAIAVMAAFMPILLVLPLANGMVLRGYLAWIGVYPVLGGLSLTAAAAGAAMTFGLLAGLGPRLTVFTARALATLFGAASFLFAQMRFLMSDSTRAVVWQAMLPAAGGNGRGAFGNPGWWPARALMGEPLPMLAMAGLGVAAVIVVSAALGQAYGSGVMGHLAAGRAALAAPLPVSRFHRSQFAALVRKEWLLLIRHPGLSAQLFYQFVFLVPGMIALLRIGEATGSRSPASVVFLTTMMTGRIARVIAVGPFEADDAASLAATAPVRPRDIVRAKLIVTTALLALVIGASLAAVRVQMPAALPAAALASIAAAATRVRLSMARPPKLRRAGLQGRLPGHAGGVLGVMIDLAWGLGGALLSYVL
jgi:ABC-2 type transport system permease protein